MYSRFLWLHVDTQRAAALLGLTLERARFQGLHAGEFESLFTARSLVLGLL
jgi:hypothetical protein